MAIEANRQRLLRTARALDDAGIPYAVIGGMAVQTWVSTVDPDAIRFTKDVDILLRREDLPRAEQVLAQAGYDFQTVMDTDMFVDAVEPSPKRAVHVVWANERVRAHDLSPAPPVEHRRTAPEGYQVIELVDLVRMKLTAYRRHDKVHLTDLIGVGLVDRPMLAELSPELAARLEPLLLESGR